jgi:hypothetical protein
MNDEYITGVDIFSESNVTFTALRIHTNKREIDIFEDFIVTPMTYKSPEGYYISGIMGNIKNSSLNKLIFKCLPIVSFQNKLNDKTSLCPKVKKFDESGNTSDLIEVSSITTNVKAIILTYTDVVNPRIVDIRVLSAYDLDQLKQTETKLKCRVKEDKEVSFVLIDNEFIKRVDIVENRSGSTCNDLIRVRFYTNYRQSPWYGNSDENETKLKSNTTQVVKYDAYGYPVTQNNTYTANPANTVDTSNLGYKTFQVSGSGFICGFYKTNVGFGCYIHNISIA